MTLRKNYSGKHLFVGIFLILLVFGLIYFTKPFFAIADISSGLVLKVDFNEGSGTVAADSIGGFNMNCPNSWVTPGANGTGHAIGPFNGTNQSCFTSSSPATSYPITMAAWVYPTGNGAIMAIANDSASAAYLKVAVSSGSVYIGARPNTSQEASCGSSADIRNGWHHVAAVFVSATERYLYVDGIRQLGCGTGQTSKVFPSSTNVLAVGRTPRTTSVDYFAGRIDTAKFYTRALSQTDVEELYIEGGGVLGPSRSNVSPTNGSYFPQGATTQTISLNTDTGSTCRYSTTAGTDYSNMSGTFSSTGGTSHTTNVPVVSGSNTFYVRCNNGTSNLSDLQIQFQVGYVRYVAPAGGVATGVCESSSPCTLSYAHSISNPGDVIELTPGSYTQRLQISRGGLSGVPITYRGSSGSCPQTPVTDPNSRGFRPAPSAVTWGLFVNTNYIVIDCIKVVGWSGITLEDGDGGGGFYIHTNRHDVVIRDSVVDGSQTPGNPYVGFKTGPASNALAYNILVERNYFNNLSHGYQAYCNNCVFQYNEISEQKNLNSGAINLDYAWFIGNNQTWYKNYFHGNNAANCNGSCHMDGFQSFGSSGYEIATNITFDSNIVFNVHQAIITRYGDRVRFSGYIIRNNVFANGPIGSSMGGYGCALLDGISNVLYEHNLCSGGRVFLVNGSDGIVRYNIFLNAASYPYTNIKTEIGATTGEWASATNGVLTDSRQNLLYSSGVTYSCGTGKYATDICNTNPLLVNIGINDFRLTSVSPGKDAAFGSSLSVDNKSQQRPQGTAPDIGPYEFSESIVTPTPTPTPAGTPIPGDFNTDHIINSLDYSLLNGKWNQNYVAYDLLADTIINSFDYAILKSNWGRTW